MKKRIALSLCLVAALLLGGCGGKNTTQDTADAEGTAIDQQNEQTDAAQAATEGIGIHHAEITIKDMGTIKIELDGDAAPITVQNFMDLAESGFYDGLTFHRIINGFMMQGGDPNGDGTGGSDQTIKGEFAENGVENDLSHTRGAISMARAQDMDSASSQFFIVHQDSTYLDGQYACFGYVTDGMDIVDKICENTPVEDSNGTVLPENQPVIESITITD
nr:peptidylprolyl isomerase [uncultured Agathobaculum sp.]